MKHQLTVNGVAHTVQADPDMPLLWVIRDFLGLTGTRDGSALSRGDLCTILMEGSPIHGCDVPISAAAGKQVTALATGA